MGFLDADPVHEQNVLNDARLTGMQFHADMSPAWYTMEPTAPLKGLASGVNAMAMLASDASIPVVSPILKPIDNLTGSKLEDWYLADNKKLHDAADYLKLDPKANGVLGDVVHGLFKLAPVAVVAAGTGGAAAIPMVAGGTFGYEGYQDALHQKMDTGTALGMGAITALSTYAGLKIPMHASAYLPTLNAATGLTVKEGLAANVAAGAIANVPLGMTTRGVTAEWLRANGYPDQAKNYEIFDQQALAVDLIMGGGFGALGHYAPAMLEKYKEWRDANKDAFNPSDKDAALALNAALHRQNDTAPGIAADLQTLDAHAQEIDRAIRALVTGERFTVGEGVTNGTWVENPSAEISRLSVAQAVAQHMGQDWVDLQHDTHQSDIGALKAELEARGMDTSMLDLSGPALERQAAKAAAVEGQPSSVQIPGAITGRMGQVKVGDIYRPTQWILVDVAQHQATLAKGENQFRDRANRVGSEAQIEKIANAPDVLQLLDSPLMDYGAPTMDRNGNIIGGNGRVEGLSRAYDRGTGNDYLGPLKDRLAQYGIDPAAADNMKKPVLMRAFVEDVNVKDTAIASNEGGGQRMSEPEQAKVDAHRLPDIRGLVLNDNGSISSVANKQQIMNWASKFPVIEQNTLIDSNGILSVQGERRFQNAILFQAFGDGGILNRLIESRDPEVRNVALALTRSGPKIAEAKASMVAGDMNPIDITPELTAAVEKLADLRRNGVKLAEYLLQNEMFGADQLSPEARKILVFLAENTRSVKAMSEMINSFFDQVKAAGNPNARNVFDLPPPTKPEILDAAIAATGKRVKNGELIETAPAADQQAAAEVAQPAPDLSNLPPGERLQYRVDNDFESLLKEYAQLPDAMGGKMVSGDIAKELSPEYMNDKTLAAEVHEAASTFAKKLYQHILDQPVSTGQQPVVLITGGGTGAGKSSGLDLQKDQLSTYNAIYDTTMGDLRSSEKKIQQALDAGRRVVLQYVYRDPVEAFVNGNLTRAMGTGRTVPISAHAESHIGSRDTIQRLAEKYAGDNRVIIQAIDNSRGRGNQAFTPLDSLPKPDSKNLGADLYAALEKEYRNANISPAVYEATAGNDRPGVSGAGGENRTGFPGEPAGSVADVTDAPDQSQELRHLQDPEVGAALADHRDMLIPNDTGQVLPASGALDIADANVTKSQLDAKAFEVAITCFLRG